MFPDVAAAAGPIGKTLHRGPGQGSQRVAFRGKTRVTEPLLHCGLLLPIADDVCIGGTCCDGRWRSLLQRETRPARWVVRTE